MYYRDLKQARADKKARNIVILLSILVLILAVAIFALSVWALAFGIMDIINNGPNMWAIIWIIIGGIGVLGSIFGNGGSK